MGSRRAGGDSLGPTGSITTATGWMGTSTARECGSVRRGTSTAGAGSTGNRTARGLTSGSMATAIRGGSKKAWSTGTARRSSRTGTAIRDFIRMGSPRAKGSTFGLAVHTLRAISRMGWGWGMENITRLNINIKGIIRTIGSTATERSLRTEAFIEAHS